MRRGGLLFAVLPAVLMAATAGRAHAASEVRLEVRLIVPPLQRLDVGQTVVTVPAVTVADLEAGYVDLQRTIVLTVHSNVPWKLSVRSRPPGDAAAREEEALPLLWAKEGEFLPLFADWSPVLSGPAGADGVQAGIRVRIPLNCDTQPGLYQPGLEYRLAPVGE